MTKKSRRHRVQYDKDELGCMSGFISFLDFRTGRSTQRLLSDRRLNVNTTGTLLNKFEVLVKNDESLPGTSGAEESSAGRPSVKALIEEEMVNEQGMELKPASSSVEPEPKQSLGKSEDSKKKKKLKRNKKASKKNCDSCIDESYPAESLESKCSSAHTEDLIDRHNENGIMEEVCTHIYEESVSCAKDEHRDVQEELSLTRAEIKKRLCEVIRKYINHHVQSKKHLSDCADNQLSKDIADALQIPNIDEEIFLKLLQDPNSPLVKYIQGLQEEARLGEDKISMPHFESNLSEQKHNGSKESKEIVPYKPHRFLWRSIKPPDTNPSNRDKSRQVPNTIIILKPGPTEQNDPPAKSSIDSSPRFPSAEKERQSDRGNSHYFFAEIKRRMKNLIGKEQANVSGKSKYESRGVIRENIGMNSSSKDHFFMEKISRASIGAEKEEKVSKMKESEQNVNLDTADNSSQRISSIYIEAKKHLSEMLSTGDERVDSSTHELPRTLGRILSLPEYTSPFASPRWDVDHRSKNAQTRSAIDETVQNFDDKETRVEENTNSNSNIDTPTETEIVACTLRDSDEKKQTLDINPEISKECVSHEEKEDATSTFIFEECSSGCENLGSTDIIIEEGCDIKEDIADLTGPSSTEAGQDNKQSKSLVEDGFEEHDSTEEFHDNQSASSPLASPSSSSNTRTPEDIEICIDKPEHASPISVLEPLFVEDDISPARTISQSADLPINPLKINFEGEDSLEKSIFTKTCPNDKAALLEYVRVVLQASGLNCNELFLRSASSDRLLEPSSYDEVHFIFQNLSYDPKLLFDCINEVLLEVCGHYFGCCPWVSFVRQKVTATPHMKAIVHEVWEGVYWHLLSLALPHSLQRTIKKDMSRSGTWVDNLCFDTEEIGIEMGDDILDDLIDDTLDQLCE